jgi:hypothetical protein
MLSPRSTVLSVITQRMVQPLSTTMKVINILLYEALLILKVRIVLSVITSLVMISLLYASCIHSLKRNLPHMPLKLYGRHSLESYGYRLGEYKGEFGKTTDWKEWSQGMQDYCVQDVVVTRKLCDHFRPYLSSSN